MRRTLQLLVLSVGRAVFLLLLLASCALPAAPAQNSDRMKVVVRREAAPEGAKVNAFDPSIDYRFSVSFRVVRIAEGNYTHDFVVCATHSRAMLEGRLFHGKDPAGLLLELTLVWDEKEKLLRLEDSRIVER